MKRKLTDQMLREALLLWEQDRAQELSKMVLEPHTFSRRHQRRMARILRRAQRPLPARGSWRDKRAVAALVAVLLAVFAALLGVSAWRTELFRFVEEKFQKYSIMFYDPLQDAGAAELDHFLVYRPTYIPEGFKLIDETINNRVQLRYIGENATYLNFNQMRLDHSKLRTNTEGVAEIKSIDFHGYEAYYYENLGNYSLIWNDGNYSFAVTSNTDRETVFQVAESVQLAQ